MRTLCTQDRTVALCPNNYSPCMSILRNRKTRSKSVDGGSGGDNQWGFIAELVTTLPWQGAAWSSVCTLALGLIAGAALVCVSLHMWGRGDGLGGGLRIVISRSCTGVHVLVVPMTI